MTFALEGASHVGVVVEDIDTAMDDLGAALGLAWAEPQQRHLQVLHLGVPVTTELRFTYSRGGPIHLELIETASGTPWAAPARMHHIGFWAPDLVGVVRELVTDGLELEATYASGGGEPFGFVYLRDTDGLRLEYVDAARRAAMEAWIAGSGDFPAVT